MWTVCRCGVIQLWTSVTRARRPAVRCPSSPPHSLTPQSVLVPPCYGYCSQRVPQIGGWIVYAGFDFPHLIRFRSVLFVSVRFRSSREGPDHVVQKPARIRSGWPAQNLANRICFRRKPVCKNHWARFCPLSYSVAFFHRRAGSYLLCNTSLDPHWFGLNVGFWPNGFGSTNKSTSTGLPIQALHAGQLQQNWPSSPTCKSAETIALTAANRHLQPKARTP